MSADLRTQGWREVRLSAKVFGHISQGLYRTPAGAIKELVSNSFDADATLVKIHTSFPRFELFSCEDDGTGISRQEFDNLMDAGFGNTLKRTEGFDVTPKYKRPVIGRLGIGLLSMAQICNQFELISHHRESQSAFKATILFPPYSRAEIDKLKQEAQPFVIGGRYRVEELHYDAQHIGLKVFTQHLRDTFRKRMRLLGERYRNMGLSKSTLPYRSFEHFLKSIYGATLKLKALSLASDYDQLIFGLALISPIPYSESTLGNIALELPQVRALQNQLRSYHFVVEMDNLSLSRPIVLPSDREGHSARHCRLGEVSKFDFDLVDGAYTENVEIKKYDVKVLGSSVVFALYELTYENPRVGGRPLKFRGYLFNQTGRIYPRDIQGVLIRVRNVAIGGYDSSLMLYPYGEGPRFSMVSAEIHIVEGFEDALNIDRDSFNSLDPHYMRVQAFMHALLHKVFPEIWEEEKLRNRRQREARKSKVETEFVESYREVSGDRIRKIVHDDKRVRPVAAKRPPVRFDSERKLVEIHDKHPLLRPALRRSKYRQLVEQISVAFERSLSESTDSGRRKIFYGLLTRIFGGMR